jgi:hypothetical protein
MSVTRIIQRRAWRSDCPAIFNRTNAKRRAENLGLKVEDLDRGREMGFQEWRRKYIKHPLGAYRENLMAINEARALAHLERAARQAQADTRREVDALLVEARAAGHELDQLAEAHLERRLARQAAVLSSSDYTGVEMVLHAQLAQAPAAGTGGPS